MGSFASAYDFESELQSIREEGRFRYLREICGPQGPIVRIGNQDLLNFCSNDYLGLANDKRLAAAMHRAIDKYGVGSGASPLICGRTEAHLILEQQLSLFTGRDRALVFSSGYLANLAVLSALGPGRNGHIYEDRLNHASLIDGALLARGRLHRYKHGDVKSLAVELSQHGNKKYVLTDAVFSMNGDIAPVRDIAAICKKYNALLAVDDAHGFGVLGENGRGTLSMNNLEQCDVPVLIVTFGKALGVSGACVAGPSEIIEMLVQKARPYIYSTAMPPALAATVSESLNIVIQSDSRREHLNNLIRTFRNGIKEFSLPFLDSSTPIQPLIIGNSEKAVNVSKRLLQQGVLVAAIRPPTVPANSSRLRITLTAAHTEAQVSRLLEVLKDCLRQEING